MTNNMRGQIILSTAGFYYVQSEDQVISCRARGKMRYEETHPLVGDFVDISVNSDGSGYVQGIVDRRNSFIRPAVANVDCLIMVASAVNPITDPVLIDRVSAIAEDRDCEFTLLLNKTDLNPADELYDIFRRTNYPVIRTSAVNGTGIAELKERMKGKLCVFTGNSGVGKSSLINSLEPELNLAVGEVSDKLGRGRHTTRHVELFHLKFGGYIADTPGFGSFDISLIDPIPAERLAECFSDFLPYIHSCRFDDCQHHQEPGCSLRQAVEDGIVSSSRYSSYLRFLSEAKIQKENEYK